MPGVPPARFAYLGPEGTFAEAALHTLPAAATATRLPQRSVGAAIEAVRDNEADAAVVPLENSVEGSIVVTVDELAIGEPLVITREVLLSLEFSLLARPDISLDQVRTVGTHPVAEAQCRKWLREHLPNARVDSSASTAAAAAAVNLGGYDAAVAAPIAGQRYRLVELARNIQDSNDAVTRFVVLARPGTPGEPTGNDKTSVVAFIQDDHTGALTEVLTEFAIRGINLTRIESRPTKERLGEYCFSLDCEGHVRDERVGDALAALRRICSTVRYLGSYPRASGQPQPLTEATSDAAFADARAWLARVRASGPS